MPKPSAPALAGHIAAPAANDMDRYDAYDFMRLWHFDLRDGNLGQRAQGLARGMHKWLALSDLERILGRDGVLPKT